MLVYLKGKLGRMMENRLTDLRMKEVVNISDGARLGCVCDVILQIPEGCVTALVVPGPCKILGMFARAEDFIIPWRCIRRIGNDIILVEIDSEKDRTPRLKKGII